MNTGFSALPTSQLVSSLNALLRPATGYEEMERQVTALVSTLQQRQLRFSLAPARRYFKNPELQQLSTAGTRSTAPEQKLSIQAQLRQRIAELGGPAHPLTEEECEPCGFFWTATDTINGYIDLQTPAHLQLLELLDSFELVHDDSPLQAEHVV